MLPNQIETDLQLFLATTFPPDPIMPLSIDPSGHLVDGIYEFELSSFEDFRITVEVESESGGTPSPGSWVYFNPQPEPPAVSSESLGFDFELDTGLGLGEDITLRIRIQDEEGMFLSFGEVAPSVPSFAAPSLFLLVLSMVVFGIPSLRSESDPRVLGTHRSDGNDRASDQTTDKA